MPVTDTRDTGLQPACHSAAPDTLCRPTTVIKITVVTRSSKELNDIFDAIRTSLSVFDLELCYQGPMPEPEVLSSVFSSIQAQQAPIIKPINFDHINLTLSGTALQSAVHGNTGLLSIAIKYCPLELGSMTQMLKSIQYHPALKSLEISNQ